MLPQKPSDLNLEINPYSPAVPVVADSHPPQPIVDPIYFDGLVHRRDLMALARNERGARIARGLMFFGAIGFAMFIIFLVSLLWLNSPSSGKADLTWDVFFLSFIIFPCLILFPQWILSGYRGGYYARRILKISPRIVGPLRGRIDNETLELRYLHYHSITPIDSLTGVRITPDAIGLTVDSRRLFLSVLPKHIFHADDFERVAARLEQIAIDYPLVAKATLTEDDRLIDGQPLALLPRPDGGIAFSGTLSQSDLSATPIFRRQIRKFFVVNLILLALAIAMPVSLYVLTSDLDLLGLLFFLVFVSILSLPLFFAVIKRLVIYRAYRKLPNAEITKLAGWVAKDNVTLHSTIGSFAYLKHAFLAVESDEQSIQCLLSGQLKQVVLLPRRFFQSDSDFEAAREILHSSTIH